MTEEQRKHLERRLLEERARALRAVGSFSEQSSATEREQAGDLTAYPLHQADEGTDTMEREMDYQLASRQTALLSQIDEALRTLYETPERYGQCERNGHEISFERLDVMPWVRTCERHAQDAERPA
jgi:DnaK suppressor protein